MPLNTDIKIHCVAQTRVNRGEMQAWLDGLGATEFELPEGVSDAALLVGVAAKRCYNSFQPGLNPNVTKVRSDWVEYLDNVMAQRHGSVLHHATWTYAVEGCTRVFTAEMNRHHAGCDVSEASMRYIRLDDELPFWLPPSLRSKAALGEVENQRRAEARDVFRQHVHETLAAYKRLMAIWPIDTMPFSEKKKLTSLFRRILPMGTCTGALYTMNMRAFRHILALRSSPGAEEEIALVVGDMARQMCQGEPALMGDFSQTDDGFWVPKYDKV